MIMERLAMLEAIEAVKPALATKDLIEQLTHVWFDGKCVMAYNDADLGIQTPLETPFTGGIRGTMLLGFLHNSRAKEVTLELGEESQMLVKAGRMRAELAVLNADQCPWQFPPPKPKKAMTIDEHLVEGLKLVMLSVGEDTSIPEKMGVTWIFGKGLRLFTTDSKTIAGVTLRLPNNCAVGEARVILPTAFCEQLIKLGSGAFLELREDCAIAGNGDGLLIFARLIDFSKPLDFVGVSAKHRKAAEGAAFPIPKGLELALERVLVLLDGLKGETVEVRLGDGKMKLFAAAPGRGEIKDSVIVPEATEELVIRLEPELLKRALPLSTSLAITKEAIFLSDGGGFVYLAGTAGV